nr:hypothetical protein [Tanacetum cinerariifolium]
MLFRDRRAHTYTRHLVETEARMSREAWVRATDASDLVHGEVMSLRTTVLDQETVNATTVTNAQLQAMIDQGVTAALAARDALRSTNGDDSHNPEQVLEGRSELLANAPTPTFLNVNHYLSKAPKELPVFPNGVKEW